MLAQGTRDVAAVHGHDSNEVDRTGSWCDGEWRTASRAATPASCVGSAANIEQQRGAQQRAASVQVSEVSEARRLFEQQGMMVSESTADDRGPRARAKEASSVGFYRLARETEGRRYNGY